MKVAPDKPTPEQIEVLNELAAAGVPSLVAYPADLEAVHRLLVDAAGTLAPLTPLGLVSSDPI